MKKYISAMAFACIVCSAHALEPYVSVGGGLSLMNNVSQDKSNTAGMPAALTVQEGYCLEAALGTGFETLPVRAEIAYSYAQNDNAEISVIGLNLYNNGQTQTTTLMLNGYYDFKNRTIITPFLLGGVGILRAKVTGIGDEVKATTWAGQVGGGLGVSLTDQLTLDFTYKYLVTEEYLRSDGGDSVNSHRFTLGIRYGF